MTRSKSPHQSPNVAVTYGVTRSLDDRLYTETCSHYPIDSNEYFHSVEILKRERDLEERERERERERAQVGALEANWRTNMFL